MSEMLRRVISVLCLALLLVPAAAFGAEEAAPQPLSRTAQASAREQAAVRNSFLRFIMISPFD